MIGRVANVSESGSRYDHTIESEDEPPQLRVHHGRGNLDLTIRYESREKWAQLHP